MNKYVTVCGSIHCLIIFDSWIIDKVFLPNRCTTCLARTTWHLELANQIKGGEDGQD